MMTLLYRVLRFCLNGCGHSHTYRERRTLHGVQVMHFVCERCGHATPVVQRTAREHRRAVHIGAMRRVNVQRRDPGQVVHIDIRRPSRPKRTKLA